MDVIQANQNPVTAIADTDLVMVLVNGAYHPIAFGNLMKAVGSSLNKSRQTNISIKGGDWLRVAKTRSMQSTFAGILTVTHGWSSGAPRPLVCFVNGSSGNADAFFAEQLTSGSWYAPLSSNQGLSFTSMRFVKESDAVYIEVLFKDGGVSPSVVASLYGTADISLVDASVSNASADKVMKAIEFSRGGGNWLFTNYLQFNSRRAGERRRAC